MGGIEEEVVKEEIWFPGPSWYSKQQSFLHVFQLDDEANHWKSPFPSVKQNWANCPIIPKPEFRAFWGDSLTKPPFGVTSAEVVIICPEQMVV